MFLSSESVIEKKTAKKKRPALEKKTFFFTGEKRFRIKRAQAMMKTDEKIMSEPGSPAELMKGRRPKRIERSVDINFKNIML